MQYVTREGEAMSHQGYIKLYRKMMHSPIWQDPYYLKIWMYCLMKASHKQHDQLIGSQIITLNPGEFVTGRFVLSDDLNKGVKPKQRQSEITWWRYLTHLEKWGMLNIKKTNKYSVVSIVKWSDYQQDEQQVNNKRTSNEQQLNTNKNDKNDKNDKKSSPKQVYDETSPYYQLSIYFLKQIRNNNPDHKEPNFQKWSNDIRLMMERDKRSEEQVKYLMKWVQENDFWMGNVLSPSKLREKFDQLVIQVKSDKGKPNKKHVSKEDFDLS